MCEVLKGLEGIEEPASYHGPQVRCWVTCVSLSGLGCWLVAGGRGGGMVSDILPVQQFVACLHDLWNLGPCR